MHDNSKKFFLPEPKHSGDGMQYGNTLVRYHVALSPSNNQKWL